MKTREAKSKLYEEAWESIRRDEEDMSAFSEVDIKALVEESGRAYRAEYVRKYSPVQEEDPAWAAEMSALLWRLALKTRNPVREAISVGLLAGLPLLPCIAISYYLVANAGRQYSPGVVALFLIAGACLAASLVLFLELRRRVWRLGVPKFNAIFNSRTFWGFFARTGGGLLVGSAAAVLIAILTPAMLRDIQKQRLQAAAESVQGAQADAKSYEEAALELAEKEAVASIKQLQDPAAASTISDSEESVMYEDKRLSVKTTKSAPKVVKRDIRAEDPNIPVAVTTEANPFGATVHWRTSGGRPALLTRYIVGTVDSVSEDSILVRVGGSNDQERSRRIRYDAVTLRKPPVGQTAIFMIDGGSNQAKDYKGLSSESSQGRTARSQHSPAAKAVIPATDPSSAATPPE